MKTGLKAKIPVVVWMIAVGLVTMTGCAIQLPSSLTQGATAPAAPAAPTNTGTPVAGGATTAAPAANGTVPPLGTGGTGVAGTTNPAVPQNAPPANPPPTAVANPTAPAAAPAAQTGPLTPQALEQAYGIKLTGTDFQNPQYLDTLQFALSRYPANSFTGLKVDITIKDINTTGGVGGFWQNSGGVPSLTVYQADSTYKHIMIHELGHHFDIFDNKQAVTNDVFQAGQVNGTIPSENIPSAYAQYGLQNQGKLPEYGAEVEAWSMDLTGAPGFSAQPNWNPRKALMDALKRYISPDKVLFNPAN